MKRKNMLESIGILSLSLLLTSSFCVSGTVPAMLEQFAEHSRASVEYLVSVPAAAMTVMIALSPFVTRMMKERFTIVLSLLIIGIAGTTPFFFSSFSVIMVSRVVLGVGIGLMNARAVSMIGERYTGELRAKLLGFRQSAETLGQTILTLIAGQLLLLSWRAPFLVYAAAFLVLVIYLTFVPAVGEDGKRKEEQGKEEVVSKKHKMTGKELAVSLSSAVFCGLLISTNVSNALRIPSYVVESGMGTAVEGNTVLSMSMFAGFLSGLFFGKVRTIWKHFLLPCFLCTGAVGLLTIAWAGNGVVAAAGAFICGFSVSGSVSYVFTNLSEQVSKESLNTANTFVLVGCNLGSSVAPMILKGIGMVNAGLSATFFAYAIVFFCIAAAMLVILYLKKK